jgi:hypothetical protein
MIMAPISIMATMSLRVKLKVRQLAIATTKGHTEAVHNGLAHSFDDATHMHCNHDLSVYQACPDHIHSHCTCASQPHFARVQRILQLPRAAWLTTSGQPAKLTLKADISAIMEKTVDHVGALACSQPCTFTPHTVATMFIHNFVHLQHIKIPDAKRAQLAVRSPGMHRVVEHVFGWVVHTVI